jgi:hypothetical protein
MINSTIKVHKVYTYRQAIGKPDMFITNNLGQFIALMVAEVCGVTLDNHTAYIISFYGMTHAITWSDGKLSFCTRLIAGDCPPEGHKMGDVLWEVES